MTWPDVIRSLLDAGVPAGEIDKAFQVIEHGGSAREAFVLLEPHLAAVPAGALSSDLLLAQLASRREHVETKA